MIQNQSNPAINSSKEEIDLVQIFYILRRNTKLFISCISFGILFSGIYAFTKEPIWEGEFQIVLESKSNNQIGNRLEQVGGSSLAFLAALDGKSNLKTEVEILKSPSILLPIFKKHKKAKEELNINTDNMLYSDWFKDNLNINLQKGTSVLNLSYRDTKKSLIKPLLQDISKAYKEYSGKERKSSIKTGIKYMDSQIAIYKDLSIKSKRALQSYAIEQNLTMIQGNENVLENSFQINIEALRVKAVNDLRGVNEKLSRLKESEGDKELILNISKQILKEDNTLKRIENLDDRIIINKLYFKGSDPNLINQQNLREELVKSLERKLYAYLNARKQILISEQKAAERPKEVIIKYRELLSNSYRNESTLDKLENQKRLLLLEDARNEKPWELITEPTLKDKKVAPSKTRILILGLFFGIFSGIISSLCVEKRKNLISDENELQSLIGRKQILTLSKNENSRIESINVLANSNNFSKGKVSLIPIGNINNDILIELKELIIEKSLNKEIYINDDILITKDYDKIIFIASPNSFTRKYLMKFQEKLNLQNAKIIDWILIENS